MKSWRHPIWIVLAVLAAGCGTFRAVTAPPDPLRVVEPKIGFNAAKVQKQISKFLVSRVGRSGLTASFGGTSPYMFSNDTGKFHTYLYGKAGYADDQAFIYDVALAVMGFLLVGDAPRAERMLDVLQKDFYQPKNGKFGLYNS